MAWVLHGAERYWVARHPKVGLLVISADQLDGEHDEVMAFVAARGSYGVFEKAKVREHLQETPYGDLASEEAVAACHVARYGEL